MIICNTGIVKLLAAILTAQFLATAFDDSPQDGGVQAQKVVVNAVKSLLSRWFGRAGSRRRTKPSGRRKSTGISRATPHQQQQQQAPRYDDFTLTDEAGGDDLVYYYYYDDDDGGGEQAGGSSERQVSAYSIDGSGFRQLPVHFRRPQQGFDANYLPRPLPTSAEEDLRRPSDNSAEEGHSKKPSSDETSQEIRQKNKYGKGYSAGKPETQKPTGFGKEGVFHQYYYTYLSIPSHKSGEEADKHESGEPSKQGTPPPFPQFINDVFKQGQRYAGVKPPEDSFIQSDRWVGFNPRANSVEDEHKSEGKIESKTGDDSSSKDVEDGAEEIVEAPELSFVKDQNEMTHPPEEQFQQSTVMKESPWVGLQNGDKTKKGQPQEAESKEVAPQVQVQQTRSENAVTEGYYTFNNGYNQLDSPEDNRALQAADAIKYPQMWSPTSGNTWSYFNNGYNSNERVAAKPPSHYSYGYDWEIPSGSASLTFGSDPTRAQGQIHQGAASSNSFSFGNEQRPLPASTNSFSFAGEQTSVQGEGQHFGRKIQNESPVITATTRTLESPLNRLPKTNAARAKEQIHMADETIELPLVPVIINTSGQDQFHMEKGEPESPQIEEQHKPLMVTAAASVDSPPGTADAILPVPVKRMDDNADDDLYYYDDEMESDGEEDYEEEGGKSGEEKSSGTSAEEPEESTTDKAKAESEQVKETDNPSPSIDSPDASAGLNRYLYPPLDVSAKGPSNTHYLYEFEKRP